MRSLEPGRVVVLATVALFTFPGMSAGQSTSRLQGAAPSGGSGGGAPTERLRSSDAGLRLEEVLTLARERNPRLQAMLDLVRRTVFLAGLLLALGVLIIVGNTIRLDIQNRRDEIEVSKLIGATDGFIRRPFLYTGAWYGLLGGLLALGLVSGSLLALDDPVRRLSGLYGSGFRLTGPGLAGGSGLVAAGMALGWLGSWVSATRTPLGTRWL